jgi:hypothetical protein
MSKQIKPRPDEQSNEQRGKAFKKFGYFLAWINFLAIAGLSLYNALKDHKPPERRDYE